MAARRLSVSDRTWVSLGIGKGRGSKRKACGISGLVVVDMFQFLGIHYNYMAAWHRSAYRIAGTVIGKGNNTLLH